MLGCGHISHYSEYLSCSTLSIYRVLCWSGWRERRVVVTVGAVGRRLALLAFDKVVRGNGLPYSLGSPRCFPKDNDYI